MKLHIWAFVFTILLVEDHVFGECNRNSLGTTECVLLTPHYSVKQWATCLTNQYIKEKASFLNKNYHCLNDVPICWYQCMLEINDIAQGPVYDNCACGNSDITTFSPVSQNPTLSNWCYSPNGASCNWYRDCLESAHPCEGADTDYAIKYAEKFCNLYQVHYKTFSSNGQYWIDLVRKCLQVELVPLLRKWREISCETIRDTAFASHSKCYVDPDNKLFSKQSFCDLPLMDMWRVFWTIKSGFVQAPTASIYGLFETIVRCRIHYKLADIKQFVSLFQLGVHVVNHLKRQKRFTDNHDPNIIAADIAYEVAKQFSWNNSGITWYSYPSYPANRTNDSNLTNLMNINILLASKRQLDLNTPDAPAVNLNQTINQAAKAVEDGKLSVPDNIGVTVTSFRGCKDLICNDTYIEVDAPVSEADTNTMVSNTILMIACFVLVMSRWHNYYG